MRLKILPAVLAVAFAASAPAKVLLQFDFDADNPWPDAATDVSPSTPIPVEPAVTPGPVGTIVKAGSADPSGGLALTAEVGDAQGVWDASFFSGLLPVANAETNPGKLTLSFDYSVSTARPVTVRFESFDKAKKRSGGLEATLYPPAADFYQRAALDLSAMKPAGNGTFNPADPFVQITFVLSGPALPSNAKHTLRLDNVCYASPAYYVSPKGSDSNDGLTEATPFEHPQKAADLSKPGDVILLMDGEYRRGGGNTDQDGLIHIEKPGSPAGWIVYKNYPGHKPVLINEDSWCAVRVGDRVRDEKYKDVPTAYLEIRGLHVRGQADKVMEKYADKIGEADPRTNGNGIAGGQARGGVAAHHLRVADCIAEYNPGFGIGFGNADWVTLENNVSRFNSWFTIYATSGMGSIGTANFDSSEGGYKTLIRNNRVSWNQTYVKWKQINKFSDGNGIIMDVNFNASKNEAYLGRTLVQNNIVSFNGGSGIHTFKANHVDIINNTAFMNSNSVNLEYGQIFSNQCKDVRIVNNIMVAPVNDTAKGGKPETVNGGSGATPANKVVFGNNVYSGGNKAPFMGTGDKVADPQFRDAWVTPWQDMTLSNFKLKPGSPALAAGRWEPFTPLTDIDGTPRPLNTPPDAGAFQQSVVR